MAGKKTPTTFNANNINDGTIYVSKFLRESGVGEVFESEAMTAEITREFPQYLQSQPRGRVLMLRVHLMRRGTSNHFADLNTLKQYFNTSQGLLALRATDEAASPNTVQLWVKPIGMTPTEGTDWIYDVSLWVPKPVWELVTLEVTTEQITATGERWTTVNNAGSAVIRPETKISVATTASAYKTNTDNRSMMRHVVIANRSANALQDANGNPYPVEITGGGWDVETEIKAGRMHPQGYDILTFLNGRPVNRWLSNFGAGQGQGDFALSTARTYESGAIAYHAQMFILPGCSERETNTVDEVGFYLIRVNPGVALGGTMVCKIRADSSGSPGAVVTNGTTDAVNASSVGTSAGFISFTWSGTKPVLTARTKYWLELSPASVTNQDASNYIAFRGTQNINEGNYEGEHTGTFKHSADESTWNDPATGIGGHNSATDPIRGTAFRVYTTGNAKIWVPMLLDPMIKRTLDRGLISGSEAAFRVNDADGTAPLPTQFAAVIENECMILRKKDGTTHEVYPLKTAARGTTAAAHKAGVAMYWAQADVRVVFNYAAGSDSVVLPKTQYEPDPLAPVIDGVNSTNASLKWIGPFAAFGEEIRPLAWRTELDDSQIGYATVTMDGDPAADDVNITFKDAAPAGSYIMRNVATQYFPTGIKNAASAISVDATPISAALEVQHLLTNARGEEELITTHRNADAGTGKLITPTDEAYRYRLRIRNGNVLAVATSDAATYADASPTVDDYYVESFVVDELTTVTAAAVRCAKGASRTFTATIEIGAFAENGYPDATQILATSGTFTNADVATAPSWTTITKSFTYPVVLAPGTYWVGIHLTVVGGTTSFYVSQTAAGQSSYSRGHAWTGIYLSISGFAGVAFSKQASFDFFANVYGTPTPVDITTGSGGTVDLDNITVTLDDATPGTPFVAFQSSNQDCWLLDAELWNVSNKKDIGVYLNEALDNSETGVDLTSIPPVLADALAQNTTGFTRYIQIDSEVLSLVPAAPAERTRSITIGTRPALGTSAATHTQGDPVYLLHQRVKLLAPMQAGESLTIDWENRTVIHSDDDLATPYQPVAIEAMDEEDPFSLGPGANELMYVETGLTAGITVDVQHTYREAWL